MASGLAGVSNVPYFSSPDLSTGSSASGQIAELSSLSVLQRGHFLIAQNFRHHPTDQTTFLFSFPAPAPATTISYHGRKDQVKSGSPQGQGEPPSPTLPTLFLAGGWCRGGLPAGSPRASTQPGGQSREGGRGGSRGSHGRASDWGMLGGSGQGRQRGVKYCWKQQQQPQGVTLLLAAAVLLH